MGIGKASSGDMEGNKPTKQDAVVKDTAFRRFMSGPYFKTIPKQYEVVAGRLNLKGDAQAEDPAAAKGAAEGDAKAAAREAPAEDYLGRLKRIVLNPVDVDGVYGLTQEELVPLPFDAPKWYEYVLDVLLGVYQVAQATIVMFIAIYVENQERAWKSGPAYTSHWQPLVKALITLYPCFTLLVLVSRSVEYTMRKFMYFRLLSMRILVDWKNVQPWETAFFYYFIGTWAMMNAWAIWGVAEYYNKFGNTGVDPTSFGTFVVVNLQTIQLLIYYTKLLSTEKRLVSLNCIFERAPVEAQSLLTYTYVVEEQDLIDECYQFQRASSRAFWKRMLNCMTCCMAAEDWNEVKEKARFDIERLKRKAANYDQVEEFTADLREEAAREQGVAANGSSHSRTRSGKVRRDSDSSHEGDKHKDERKPEVQGPNDIALTVLGGDGAAGAPAVAAPDVPSDTPGGAATGHGRSCLGSWTPMRWVYQRYYASTHTWHVGLMVRFYSWPFRPDVPYFRMLMIMEILGWVAVGVIVVLGWLLSARNSNCTKAAKTCNTCLTVHERYFASAEPLCTAMETAVSAIVASANGTWVQNGRVEERYCNFACYGNFVPNGNATCPVGGP